MDHQMNSASLFESIRARWKPILHELGLKCTEQRLAVLHELEIAAAPMSHRDLMDRLGPARWDPTTTFRNLNDLFEAGLVTRIDVGDHTWRFELLGKKEGRSARHAHFLCVACGAIECLPEFSLAETADQLHLLLGRRSIDDVLVKGRCFDCTARSES
jgi:Fur family ferric uptake transcriptional regulator